MSDVTAVANGLRYPQPGSLERLTEDVAVMENAAARRHMESFVAELQTMSLSEREELHTVTLDLSPLLVPYVGHVVWGDNYRRGAFMADLNRELMEAGVDLLGELPDHLEPILRYLDAVDDPLVDLVDVLPQALMRMRKDLRKEDKRSPYLHLLDAVEIVINEAIGALRSAAR